jgi:hypothetical protein
MNGFSFSDLAAQILEMLSSLFSEFLQLLLILTQLTVFTLDVATNNPNSPNDVRRDFDEEMAEEIAIAAFVAESETGIPAPELIAIAWRESRFRLRAIGDSGRSCGPMQIRWDIWSREHAWNHTDFDGTGMTCQDLKNWDFAMLASAHILSTFQTTCSTRNYLAAYNGGCRRAEIGATQAYQNRVRHIASRFEHWDVSPKILFQRLL